MKYNDYLLAHKTQEIYNNLLRYAYENANTPPLIYDTHVDYWFGEVFDVSNMKNDLHYDIIYYLKKYELYENINNNCDKYVILPDVFSYGKYPISDFYLDEIDEDGVMDTDATNIVILNNKVFELVHQKVNGVCFNYNNKFYYFYDSSIPEASVFDGINKQMNVINTRVSMEFDYSNNFNLGQEIKSDLTFYIDIDNKLVDPETTTEDFLEFTFNYPYIKYDVEEQIIESFATVEGLHSTNEDDYYIMNKIPNLVGDNLFFHNRNISFSETSIVVFKDNTWQVQNDDQGYYDKLDKHTILFKKDDNVKEIYVFYKPVFIDDTHYKRVDTIYDELLQYTPYAYYAVKDFKKNTLDLYRYLVHSYPTIDEIIDYGYKEDLDVLRIIQMAFPSYIIVKKNEITVAKQDKFGNRSETDQLFITVENTLNLNPLVFIDGKLVETDISNYYENGVSYIHINLSYNEFLNNILKQEHVINKEEIMRNLMIDHKLEVAFISNNVGITNLNYIKEHKTLIEDTRSTIIENFEDTNEHIYFVNGYLSRDLLSKRNLFTNSFFQGKLITSKMRDTTSINKIINLNGIIDFTLTEESNIVKLDNINLSPEGFLVFDESGTNITRNILDYTGDTFSVEVMRDYGNKKISIMKLSLVDYVRDIDLEIDYSRVKDRLTSFNEFCLSKPDIVNYIKQNIFTGVYNLPYELDVDIKTEEDVLLSYGSVNHMPYDMNAYHQFLTDNNITVLDAYNLLKPEYKYSSPYSIFKMLASNYVITNNLTNKLTDEFDTLSTNLYTDETNTKYAEVFHYINAINDKDSIIPNYVSYGAILTNTCVTNLLQYQKEE